MNNELAVSAIATDQKAQYDACAKRLLGHKIILAHILIRVVDEFKNMDAETVASLIEGEPYISQVPVEPGRMNKETVDTRTGERIVGLNTENSEINEGKIYFDIVFYVRMRDGLAKDIPPKGEKYELHRLLGTLLSQTMAAEQKLKLMKQEYNIPVERNGIREGVNIMCNLSEGVEEMGYARGEAAGILKGKAEGKVEGKAEGKAEIILKMYKKGYSMKQIIDVTDMTIEEIKAIIE